MLATRRNVIAGLGSISLGCCVGCHRVQPEPVTIMFVDPEWVDDRPQRRQLSEEALGQFESETGIKVKHLPAPETPQAQLRLMQGLLGQSDSPDVFGIDVIWSGLLDGALLDLKPFFSSELSSANPDLVAPYTVKGRILAIPYHPHVGVLYYRTDLLQKYGYRFPPLTWSDLEKMAFHIQQGERALGEKDFWGFVWPGAPDEGLTCLALEWQASEGGGKIIEADRTVSVNNENAIRAWERAAHWIGRISPPNVAAYEELDSVNYFEDQGKAAFRRGWTSHYFLSNPAKSMIYGKMGVTSVPAGKIGVGTLGGFGLGISVTSKHQPQAVALVKFLLRKESQLESAGAGTESSKGTAVCRLPIILNTHGQLLATGQAPGDAIVSRPSMAVGRNYEEVSHAYAGAVHSVLTGKKQGHEAAQLERELERITGFPKGSPEQTEPDHPD